MYLEEKIDRILALLEGAEPAAPNKARGRPVKGEETAPAAAPAQAAASPATSTPALAASAPDTAPEEDPFADKPAAPTVTSEQLRDAATRLSKATSQNNAVAVMKAATGATNFGALKPEQYGVAYQAFETAIANTQVSDDPFAAPAATAPSAPASTPVTSAPSLADVKAAVIAAQKRTGTDVVQSIVVKNGGVAGSPPQVSLKALHESKYAQVIAEIAALPSTK